MRICSMMCASKPAILVCQHQDNIVEACCCTPADSHEQSLGFASLTELLVPGDVCLGCYAMPSGRRASAPMAMQLQAAHCLKK